MKKINITKLSGTVATLCLLLSGCQQTPPSFPTASVQVNQLSSLIAGSRFLRDQCGFTDISNDAVLLSNAIGMAKKRGWNIHAAEYQDINQQVRNKVVMLEGDNMPLQQKCQQLHLSLANVVAGSPSRS